MRNAFESDSNGEAVHEARISTGSEVVLTGGGPVVTTVSSGIPTISALNISKSSRVHVGPKFVSVTQNVTTEEGIKELPLPRYVWNYIKSTTWAERLFCALAVVLLVVCVILILNFTLWKQSVVTDPLDAAPHPWNITREMWLGRDWEHNPNYTTLLYQPLNLVVIQHTVSPECSLFINCASEMRNLQESFIAEGNYDIPYNFVVGNDGRVYEARGWGIGGAHTRGYNLCSVGVGFIGDYREESNTHTKVTPGQVRSFHLLMEDGIRMGYVSPDYYVLGAKDLHPSESPGSNLYNEIRRWPHYDHSNRFHNRTCAQIKEMFHV